MLRTRMRQAILVSLQVIAVSKITVRVVYTSRETYMSSAPLSIRYTISLLIKRFDLFTRIEHRLVGSKRVAANFECPTRLKLRI